MKKDKKKKEESIEENVKEKYPLADEMLATIRQEYEIENDRKKTLDTKACTSNFMYSANMESILLTSCSSLSS